MHKFPSVPFWSAKHHTMQYCMCLKKLIIFFFYKRMSRSFQGRLAELKTSKLTTYILHVAKDEQIGGKTSKSFKYCCQFHTSLLTQGNLAGKQIVTAPLGISSCMDNKLSSSHTTGTFLMWQHQGGLHREVQASTVDSSPSGQNLAGMVKASCQQLCRSKIRAVNKPTLMFTQIWSKWELRWTPGLHISALFCIKKAACPDFHL